MPQTVTQEWFGFALLGISLFLAGVIPALPASADPQTAALGMLLVFSAGTGMLITSPTVVDALDWLDSNVIQRFSTE